MTSDAAAALRRLPLAAIAPAVDPTVLHLIVMPTEKCNFRCIYCYEDFALGRMPTRIRTAVVRLVERRLSDLRRLSISWFGGEPLLAADLIDEISTGIGALNGSSMQRRADMTTNGYLLTPSMMTRMVGNGISRYQVSLDGFKDTHDATRRLAGGGGTFERIWSNLLELRDSREDFRILLRLHAHPLNHRGIRELAGRVRDDLLPDGRFEAIIRPVQHLGSAHDGEFDVHDANDAYAAVSSVANDLGLRSTHQDLDDYVCYAAKANSLVIRANGDLSKCTVALDDPRNIVGRINDDGSLTVDQTAFSAWMEGLRTRDKNTLECPSSVVRNTVRGEIRPGII